VTNVTQSQSGPEEQKQCQDIDVTIVAAAGVCTIQPDNPRAQRGCKVHFKNATAQEVTVDILDPLSGPSGRSEITPPSRTIPAGETKSFSVKRDKLGDPSTGVSLGLSCRGTGGRPEMGVDDP
jgi:hypothetical protein